MKILHTSDWHLGQVFYGYERDEEHRAFLGTLVRIVSEEQPDAMIVSGDVFHNSAPSAAARRMYVDGMLEICRACPEMTVVVTAGNHDSPSRLEADAGLWRHFNVHVIGSFARKPDGTADPAGQVIDVVRNGQVIGHIAAVPYASPRSFPETDAAPDRMSAYFHALDAYMQGLGDGLPCILAAHLAVAGCDIRGHDDVVGGLDYVPLETLGNSYDYIALGHIHSSQILPGGRAVYCGSPVAVNFDEREPHSVSVVEIADGVSDVKVPPQVRMLPVPNARPLLTIPDKTPEDFPAVLERLKSIPLDSPAYVRLNVLVNNTLPSDCEQRAADILKGGQVRYCCMKVTRPENKADGSEYEKFTVQEMRQMDPLDVAGLYYRLTRGREMEDRYVSMFKEAVRASLKQ